MDDGADPATVADRPEPLDTPIEDVHRIEFSVEWPPGHVAAYLLDGPEPLLIDAGMTGEQAYDELEEGLARAGYDTADVAHLVVTHPHVDHIGQVPAVIEAADPLVYAPAGVRDRLARDAEALASAVERNATAAGIVGERRERSVEMAVRSLERNRDLLAPSNVDCWIGDGNGRGANGTEERQESQKGKKSAKHERDERSGKDEESEPDAITVGGVPFEAIATPGHQADHLCFETAMDGERVLFAGDTALAPFRPVLLQVGLDEGVERGLPAFKGSLDRLSARSIDRVFPGHGPVHDDFHDTLDRDCRSLRRLVEGVARELDGGVKTGTTAAEIASERAGGERDFAYLLPEVVSALARLDATGRARVTTDETGVRRYRQV